jgi:DNA-binding NarL/FixJ family response regulator
VEQLTGREQEILKLLAKGYMYKEIADHLTISMSTVRTHITAVYEKLHVHSRTEAAMKLVGQG